MTLVYTSDVGPNNGIVELAAPAKNPERARMQTLDSSLVANVSGVAGATVTAALDELLAGQLPGTDVQTFSGPGNYTWTKPANARRVTVYLFPVGGAGGSGRKQTTPAINASGGGGGAPGGPRVFRDIDAAELGATENVTIGANSIGGASQTVGDTNGNNGTNGGTTSFGPFSAPAGDSGQGGTTAQGNAGSFSTAFDGMAPIGVRDGTIGAPSGGTNQSATTTLAPSGGAGAGGVGTLGTVASNGGNAGANVLSPTVPGGTVGAGQDGSNGADGLSGTSPIGGQGGSGGAGNTTGADAGRGGNGGFPSGGGGGGGGANNGGNSGRGGDGGGALVIVITQCA